MACRTPRRLCVAQPLVGIAVVSPAPFTVPQIMAPPTAALATSKMTGTCAPTPGLPPAKWTMYDGYTIWHGERRG
ncbi:unnamed protein product [Pylaiella littoralis]